MAKFEVNEDLIRKLADLLAETGLSEIEYEANEQRVRVARGGVVHSVAAAPLGAEALQAEAEAVPANALTSPMVGTVYVAGEPTAPPFVKVGDMVSEGQTLLIIEAMKVMNPLPSPRAGKVTRIMVSNGDPVEFGEPLMIIE